MYKFLWLPKYVHKKNTEHISFIMLGKLKRDHLQIPRYKLVSVVTWYMKPYLQGYFSTTLALNVARWYQAENGVSSSVGNIKQKIDKS